MKKLLSKGGKFLMSLLGIAIVIGIWALAYVVTDMGRIFPSPWGVWHALIQAFRYPVGTEYTMWGHLAMSLRRVMIGFGLGAVCGIVLGILIGRSKMVDAIVRPIFEIIRPIPSVAWIPLAIIWFGIKDTAKIFIIFMAAFGGMTVQMYSGARRVDEEVLGVAKMLGASERQTFFNVVLPSCVPYLFTGLHAALSTSWMAVLAAEMVSAREGVGWVITVAQQEPNMELVLAGVVVIAVVGLLLSTIMHNLERFLCRWRVKGV